MKRREAVSNEGKIQNKTFLHEVSRKLSHNYINEFQLINNQERLSYTADRVHLKLLICFLTCKSA